MKSFLTRGKLGCVWSNPLGKASVCGISRCCSLLCGYTHTHKKIKHRQEHMLTCACSLCSAHELIVRPGPRVCVRSDDWSVSLKLSLSYSLSADDFHKQPSVAMTSAWLQLRANQRPPSLTLGCFTEPSKRLTVSHKVIYCCVACSEIPLCISPHKCRLFTERWNSRGMAVRKGPGCYGY